MERSLHGVRLTLPDGWADRSMYRFAIPTESADPIVPRRLQSNLIAMWHQVPRQIPLDRIFEAPNAAARRTGELKILGSGTSRYLDQDAVWQDVESYEVAMKLTVYQRQIGIRPKPDELLIISLTSDHNDLEALGRQIGFATQ